jgi:alpha-beta hydrolase superfamily lysophospholipase
MVPMSKSRVYHSFIDLYNNSGDRIRGELRYIERLKESPVIIICHSFMAFKEWGFFPYVAERFAENNYVTLTFNFSHNGVGGDDDRITQFDRFARNTYSKELEDLQAVIDTVWAGEAGGGIINRAKIILLGHSRGGGISILRTAEDERIKALISWSAVGKFDRWTEHQKKQWRSLQYLPLSKDPGVSPLRLGIGLLNDIEHQPERFDLRRVASRISIPWLLLHGSADVIVPPEEAKQLRSSSGSKLTELKLLDGIGHMYNATNKEEDNYKTLDTVIDITLQWLKGII